MQPNISRLEACLRANEGRPHLCMKSWDSCLIGGYDRRLAADAYVAFDHDKTYAIVGKHFSITATDAKYLFRGGYEDNPKQVRTPESALARLRAFIDANQPSIASLDFHRVDSAPARAGGMSAQAAPHVPA